MEKETNNKTLLDEIESINESYRYKGMKTTLNILSTELSEVIISFNFEMYSPETYTGLSTLMNTFKQIIREEVSEDVQDSVDEHITSDTSPHVVAIGTLLMPLYHTYPEIHKINVGRQIIDIYMFNNNEDSELCFVIAGTEDSDRFDCNLFLDSDLCSSPSNFNSYDDILSDIAHMIYAVDDSYNKHHIDIETFIEYSDTAQNPLWKID